MLLVLSGVTILEDRPTLKYRLKLNLVTDEEIFFWTEIIPSPFPVGEFEPTRSPIQLLTGPRLLNLNGRGERRDMGVCRKARAQKSFFLLPPSLGS